ncbi:replication-associated protein [Finch associated genomovirus 1]|uniref:Replication-associated protein n=1 Tax=Finch associated genomovirus 1 TaxID=2576453 RepID=A0A4P8PL27_9VIRU|nr:replication-associated protein [Finch associated genomovirus 1]QCQ85268.1 replication-associated protein [Finch associated genomovirus 1]
MPFLFQAKYGLLTYAQCGGLDPFEVCEHLGRLGAECIIGREDHEDGGVHLHAFFMFEREYRTRDERHFDVGGCHPNVVRGYGTPEKGYDYAIKDGDIVAGGLARPCRDGVSKDGNVWAQLVLAGDREEFFDMCTRLVPRALLCNFTSLRCYADWKYRTDPDEYEHPRSVQLSTSRYPELDSWVQSNLGGHGDSGRRRSLIIYGPTRTGKTLWARSLAKHAYFGGLFCLDESLEGVEYAIFDDMQGGLKFFHAYKFWLGCQSQFWATDKYKGKKLIRWGRPSIYISNSNPLCDEGVDHDWLIGNCDFVEVTESLLMPVEASLGEEI